ncbi:MAG: hypothetical protein P8107_02970, partial [Spirochaetia bacterium]
MKTADKVALLAKGKIEIPKNAVVEAGKTKSWKTGLTLQGIQKDQPLFLEFSCDDPQLLGQISGHSGVFKVRYRFGSDPQTIEVATQGGPDTQDFYRYTNAVNVFGKATENLLPAAYRGWSVFAYNAGTGEKYLEALPAETLPVPIDEDKLILNENYTGVDVHDSTSARNAQEPGAYLMYPGAGSADKDAGLDRWKSEDDECWVKAVVMSSSRKGDNHPRMIDISNHDDGEGEVKAVIKLSLAVQDMLSLSAVGTGLSAGTGSSKSLSDYLDMNGDGFPDVLSEKTIHFTGPTGVLNGQSSGISGIRDYS